MHQYLAGLIINEIISNSLKYAFPDNRDGIIFVTLRVDKNKVKIEVGDNGIGIPENVDIKNTQTLGLTACRYPCRAA
jgi:two-component sensor histidine kinase